MKYWVLLILLAVSGSVFAETTKYTEQSTDEADIEVRQYAGVTYDSTVFAVVHDTRNKVTCYITESGEKGSSPTQTCFPDDEIR